MCGIPKYRILWVYFHGWIYNNTLIIYIVTFIVCAIVDFIYMLYGISCMWLVLYRTRQLTEAAQEVKLNGKNCFFSQAFHQVLVGYPMPCAMYLRWFQSSGKIYSPPKTHMEPQKSWYWRWVSFSKGINLSGSMLVFGFSVYDMFRSCCNLLQRSKVLQHHQDLQSQR